ncbi:glutathione-dependent formaldehyde dehydrogenase [Lujinxingia litoralis]|uniref:Glutathione-dependent formaldehyde dehydrogenase n=1 Tax=Lujinxingia litoralis TaxID=2211119 RepID=A0A328CCV5_9DELT|nr:zinc-dependent alcohol dehydrogenase [Lujinxingia litoralis]RAL25111.1 glutathione-dependent formaldehyde dehydrogenase [Lujinxingia litoralis]
MRALCWFGKHDLRFQDVPDPSILNPHDAIIRVSLTAIGGSDLALYQGKNPTMEAGDILGHEFMGEVVEVGPEVAHLEVGDRVVVPAPIACGRCHHCQHDAFALCDNSNPNAWMAERVFGHSPAGIFGYSHLFGGYAGGQAEYVRVPFADVGPIKVPEHLSDEKVLFLSDLFPTGYQAVDVANMAPGSTVAIWGCGPVGLFAIKSAFMLGAERVFAIDNVPDRLAMARHQAGAEVLNFADDPIVDALKEMTGGRGPQVCIDAAGMEGHHKGSTNIFERARLTLGMESRTHDALLEAILACAKGGTLVLPGIAGEDAENLPLSAAFSKGLTLKMGPTHVQRYLKPLLARIEKEEIDPGFVITHRLPLVEGPEAYQMLHDKEEGCIKVVMRP